jgi:hypothetical protein
MAVRVLRAAITTSLALALFVLARPARAASAPFCDDRGASAIAAPPVLEEPHDAIRRASVTSCDTDDRFADGSIGPGRRLPARSLAAPEPAVAPQRAILAPPSSHVLRLRPAPAVHLPEGIGLRVERPPRA